MSSALFYVPLIAIACHLNPDLGYRRANGYDCVAARAAAQGGVTLDTRMSDIERMIVTHRALSRLSAEAEQKCGGSCRFFYGGQGLQCLSIAQSERYTGLGSFMGRETTKADAEATALRDCRDFVGNPGTECTIIMTECPPGVG